LESFVKPRSESGRPAVLFSAANVDQLDSRARSSDAKFRDNEEEEEEEDNLEGPCDAFTHAFRTRRVFGMGFCGRLCDNELVSYL
jgi:hypothetical protein